MNYVNIFVYVENLGEKLNDEEIQGLLDEADVDSEGTIRCLFLSHRLI
jgi:Ca2+-binding EF-hand superfamily protein